MKLCTTRLIGILLCIASISLARAQTHDTKNKLTLAVMGFVYTGRQGPYSRTAAADVESRIGAALPLGSWCQLVEKQIVKNSSPTNPPSPGGNMPFGNISGADYIIYGTVDDVSGKAVNENLVPQPFRNKRPRGSAFPWQSVIPMVPGLIKHEYAVHMTVTVRMAEVESGKIVIQDTYEGIGHDRSMSAQGAYDSAVNDLQGKFRKKIKSQIQRLRDTFTSEILEIRQDGSRSFVRINMGSTDNIAKGDVLELVVKEEKLGLNGKKFTDYTPCCFGRVKEVNDKWAKLEIGHIRGKSFVPDSSLISTVNDKCFARLWINADQSP